MLRFSKKEKQVGAKLYQKFVAIKKKNQRAPLISFDYLHSSLNKEEKFLLKKVLSVNPKEYGKHYTIFYGLRPVPRNLIAIKSQKYFSNKDKKFKKIKTQFLPTPVFRAFTKMKMAMCQDLGTVVNVTSGYRSSAYQALVLFVVLVENKWSLKKTLQRLTLPGCSEHGWPARQAMDVAPIKGIKDLRDFDKTEEYKWLLKNAKKFSFSLSYPKGNKYGVMFEPWHWRYGK